MSPVEACRGCGGLFPYLPRGYCADCIDRRERNFQDVREWLLDNRGASTSQAADATGVDESLILSFIREGRLEFVGASSGAAEDEDLKERIRRDLAAREAAAPARSVPPSSTRGMRTRAS